MADFIFKISPNIMLGSYLTARLGQFVKEWGTKYMLILDPDLQDFDIGDKISMRSSSQTNTPTRNWQYCRAWTPD